MSQSLSLWIESPTLADDEEFDILTRIGASVAHCEVDGVEVITNFEVTEDTDPTPDTEPNSEFESDADDSSSATSGAQDVTNPRQAARSLSPEEYAALATAQPQVQEQPTDTDALPTVDLGDDGYITLGQGSGQIVLTPEQALTIQAKLGIAVNEVFTAKREVRKIAAGEV